MLSKINYWSLYFINCNTVLRGVVLKTEVGDKVGEMLDTRLYETSIETAIMDHFI